VRSARIDDLDATPARSFYGIDERHRLARSIVVQAQDDQVHLFDQRAFGGRVFALCGGNADQLDLVQALQALTNLQSGGAGFAVNEYFVHGVSWGQGAACQFRQRMVRRNMIHLSAAMSTARRQTCSPWQTGEIPFLRKPS